ncbi:regulatory iron-sulfur-containing complex subunit RicT [Eggerthella sp. YY7918]|uniref:PSP1 domain-containing protein n=1 Tax=Eggerthella sp. (strain YY7918) TaxID=502558 RepID=UPI00021713C8|nr:regulatory iron-sulfur-containing complex subunit RicT [Eggerthella sp. YY7918]BAK44268.1 hypothetical protein EGYY_10900 [Eggerthella sp. YY7918]
MVRIAPVNLYYNPKTLWFDAGDFDINPGAGVVVSTARGTEFGRTIAEVFEADEKQIKKLKTPLKEVIRIATDEDEAQAAEMERKSAEALPVFKEMAAEANSDMHPVSVEYLLDGDKAVFYFEAEERVDFRDLVRKLAAHFHVRIDMRQIGVRDEARMVGGLGHCGQELCCKRLGGEFCPVSIRMAKEQDLSLNPQKISGVCGRLMCCLRYEFDAYKDFKSRAPKQNAQVETPVGPAKVVDLDVPREIISLKVEGEKPVKVPLADFDPPEEGSNRPNRVGAEAWESATERDALGVVGDTSSLLTPHLTGQDKLADPASVRHTGQSGQKSGRGSSAGGKGGAKKSEAPAAPSRKPRRRRSTKVGGNATETTTEAQKRAPKQKETTSAQKGGPSSQGQKKRQGQSSKKQQAQRSGGERAKDQAQKNTSKSSPRPGQKSSGLRQRPQSERGDSSPGAKPSGTGQRRPRRRSHKTGEAGASGGAGKRTDGGKGAPNA